MNAFERFETPRSRADVRAFLSLLEVAVLANISEKRVRKDIETGILRHRLVRWKDARLCFTWPHVYTFAAVYGNDSMNGKLRKVALEKSQLWEPWFSSNKQNCECPKVSIDRFIMIDLAKVCDDVSPRVGVYADGLSRIEEKDEVLGGNAVFRGTRLSVHHVGKMLENGANRYHILEDYPYLSKNDLDFAELYCRAHPIVGRPRTEGRIDELSPIAG